MKLELDADEAFFLETTARFLAEHAPVDALRKLRDDPAGFDDDYWRRGAELGWTSLLVPEAMGGGTISGDGLSDLALVAYEFGRTAAPGPLATTSIVAAALAADGDRHADVLAQLLSGASVATWCHAEPRPNDGFGVCTLEARVDGAAGDVVLTGAKRPVESADRAAHLLVTGRTDGGLTQVLVPASTPGVSIAPMRSVDLTRRFFSVTFDDVRLPGDAVVGTVAGAAAAVERQLRIALVLANAESVGAMQRGFDMTVEWAFDRYSFGRPLASYQELKHRFADMKVWLEASHAVSDEATVAVSSASPDADVLASAAKAYIGDHGSELLQDCVQIHGGIGVTFEHDLHLYFRRHTLNRALFGTPVEHRRRVADLVEQREGTGA